MSSTEQDPISQAQRTLESWHTTHPDATFAEIEVAVEAELDQIRTHLLQERTGTQVGEAHPACRHCGSTMRPRSTLPPSYGFAARPALDALEAQLSSEQLAGVRLAAAAASLEDLVTQVLEPTA